MKTIGLIGGMSWESTVSYYNTVNTIIKRELGGLHSAKCVLYSVDFYEVEKCQAEGRWADSALILADAAVRLEKAGADFILICTNTMHKIFSEVRAAVSVPFIHIADAMSDVLMENRIYRVGLLGTKYTMEQDFYKSRLVDKGLDVLIPDEADRHKINGIIYEELCLGIISEGSKKMFLSVIAKMAEAGAGGVILGCTEIGLLVKQADTDMPLFDTAEIHAEKAALAAIRE